MDQGMQEGKRQKERQMNTHGGARPNSGPKKQVKQFSDRVRKNYEAADRYFARFLTGEDVPVSHKTRRVLGVVDIGDDVVRVNKIGQPNDGEAAALQQGIGTLHATDSAASLLGLSEVAH